MADETTPVAVPPAPTVTKPAAAKPAEKVKVVAPAFREYPTIPALRADAMIDPDPYAATAAHNEAMGFPGTLVDGWEQKAVAKMGELLGK